MVGLSFSDGDGDRGVTRIEDIIDISFWKLTVEETKLRLISVDYERQRISLENRGLPTS